MKLFFPFRKMGYSLALVVLPVCSIAQSNKEDAKEKARRAFKLEDEEQKYDDAIRLLQDAKKLDPEKADEYSYEISYAYYLKKDFSKTIEIIEPLKASKSANPRFYQLLGNSYDELHKPEKAITTYEEGIKKFPKSGELLMEMGTMMYISKNYEKAVDYYEQGIKAEPTFASNYYRAAGLYLQSKNEVFGMIYGEIFMNMEPNTERTSDMSKRLYDTYKSEIKYTSDTSMSISFYNEIVMSPKDIKHFKLPFGSAYEMDMLLAAGVAKSIDLNSIDLIRQQFIDNYFSKDDAKNYPNVLFDYQLKIKKAGQMEAYNHWLLMKGDETAFTKWHNANKEKWESFVKWYNANPLVIDKNHTFLASQY